MKDKKCSEFVFMPLREVSRGPTPRAKGEGGSKDKVASSGSDSNLAAAAAASTEVRSKIVIVGSCQCGKTALIHRYVQSAFLSTYSPTGFETFNSEYSVSSTYKIQMSIWDTSGDQGYDRVRPLSYSEADLIIICFAIDRPDTMEDVVSKWFPEVKEYCPTQPIMLVGCRSDMRSEIKNLPPDRPRPSFVTYDQGLKTAKHIGALVYSETSSKISQRSVNDVMEVAALSSAGSKSGCSFNASSSSGTTTTTSNGSTGSSVNSSSSTGSSVNSSNESSTTGDSPNFKRQRSFIRRKRFTEMSEAKAHLRKEAAKSCIVM